MTRPDDIDPRDLDLDVPGDLAADLRRLYRPAAAVPESVDDAVLAMARQRLATVERSPRRARSPRPRLTRWLPAVATVAAVVAMVWVTQPGLFRDRGAFAGDIDGNGTVDILDAMRLAMALERGQAQPGWDVNGDEQVDDVDVDAIARRAVRLRGGTP